MTRKMLGTGMAVVAAIAAIGWGTPAQAAGASLELQWRTASGKSGRTTLECEPVGGRHPARVSACAVLEAADGSMTSLEPLHRGCPGGQDQVTAIITGTWGSRTLSYLGQFSNPCLMRDRTHGVMAF